jgi:hypothetical protein
VAVMKDICSHMYSNLAQAEAHALPENLSNTVQYAVDSILENDDILGPVPVTFETLKGSPEVYAQCLWHFLNEMETFAASTRGVPSGRQMQQALAQEVYYFYSRLLETRVCTCRCTTCSQWFKCKRISSNGPKFGCIYTVSRL